MEKYGARLVCVRCKYDERSWKRYTTVELIEEESDWAPETAVPNELGSQPPAQPLAVRVEYWETGLHEKVKEAGGICRPRHKLWELRYEDVMALGLNTGWLLEMVRYDRRWTRVLIWTAAIHRHDRQNV